MTILFYGEACARESGTPDVLLGVEGGKHYGLVVDIGSVLVDGGGGLGAEVAVARVEVERGDVVRAVRASELHAAFDASDGVEAFHRIECSLLRADEKARGVGSEGNAGGGEGSSIVGMGLLWKLLARPRVMVACKGSFDCGCPSRLGAKDNPRSG